MKLTQLCIITSTLPLLFDQNQAHKSSIGLSEFFDFNPWLTLKAFTYAWVRFCSMQSFPCIHRNIAKYNDRSNFHVPLNVYVVFVFFKLIKYRAPNDTQFARL